MENFGKFMAIVMSMIFNPIIRGYVFLSLWAWFIVPTFSVNPLRLIEAIGLMFIVGYLSTKFNLDEKEHEKSFAERMITATLIQLFYSGIVLLFGWIIFQFV